MWTTLDLIMKQTLQCLVCPLTSKLSSIMFMPFLVFPVQYWPMHFECNFLNDLSVCKQASINLALKGLNETVRFW
jgi:hypothetical protein